MYRSLAFSLLAAITASPALAAPVAATATLAAPARSDRAVTPEGVWRCTADSCTGNALPITGEAVGVCSAVADHAGRVKAFTVGALTFAEAELARCNRHVKS